MTSADGENRDLRADARRNREHILDIARERFLEHGVGVSLDGVAKRAGIGIGTLYRHFPNREVLLAALLSGRDGQLMGQMNAIKSESSDPAEALDRWLCALAGWASAYDGLPEPLRNAIPNEASPLGSTCESYIAITADFLADAQREGAARPGVRARDLFLLTLATSWVRGAALADEQSAQELHALTRASWTA
jgi:AcrR family transcriptional regulator